SLGRGGGRGGAGPGPPGAPRVREGAAVSGSVAELRAPSLSPAPPKAAVIGGARSRRAGWLLVLASLVVYNANLREISSADTIATRLVPVALVQERRLALDRYFRDDPALPYWVQRAGGHYVSSYPTMPGILAVPVYFLPILAFGDGSWALINGLAKLSASLMAALSVLFVYLAARRLAPESAAMGVALVYAFGTATWSVSSQGLWGHAPAQLFMAVAIHALLASAGDRRAL